MSRFKLQDILIRIYMAASVLAVITIADQNTSEMFFALGAKSWFVCLILGGSESLGHFLGVLVLIWVFSFPVLFVIFYIMASKENYVPFCVITALDSLIALLWYFTALRRGDAYALRSAGPDAVVSTVYTLILIISLYFYARKDTARQGTVLREP